MSVEALGRTLAAPIGKTPKLVLVGLANHAHPDGSHAYPSVQTLATYAHCDPRTVHRCLRELEALGYVERTGRMPDGRVVYRVVFGAWEAPDKMPPPPPGKLSGGDDPQVTPPLTPRSPEPSFNQRLSMESPGRAREDEQNLEDLAELIRGILQRGIDGLSTDERTPAPGRGAILEALLEHRPTSDEALEAAQDTRGTVQAQNRAPNVAGLYAAKLAARCAQRAATSSADSAIRPTPERRMPVVGHPGIGGATG